MSRERMAPPGQPANFSRDTLDFSGTPLEKENFQMTPNGGFAETTPSLERAGMRPSGIPESQFDLLAEVARELGVQPCLGDPASLIWAFVTPDGCAYDLLELSMGGLPLHISDRRRHFGSGVGRASRYESSARSVGGGTRVSQRRGTTTPRLPVQYALVSHTWIQAAKQPLRFWRRSDIVTTARTYTHFVASEDELDPLASYPIV